MSERLMQNPWDRLPKKPQGDAEDITIFTAVGRALHTWEGMEDELARLFGYLCRSPNEVAERAYGVVQSSTGRVDMLLEACACYPNMRPKIEPIVALAKLVRHYTGRRNEIAHGRVLESNRNEESQGFFLCSPRYNSRKTISEFEFTSKLSAASADEAELLAVLDARGFGSYAYTSDQIGYYCNQFNSLRERAHWIHHFELP